MAGTNPKGKIVELRGRVYANNPSHDLCVSAANSGTAFKTLLGLADDAVLARGRLNKMLDGGHPLMPLLNGMNCAEAITYLLGVTLNFTEHPAERKLSDKNATASSDNKTRQVLRSVQETPAGGNALTPGEKGAKSPAMLLELDDDMLDAFSSFPVT